MAKANQNANGIVPVKGGTDKKHNATWKSRALLWIGSCMIMSVFLVGNAAAATEVNYSVDWTPIIDMVEGMAPLMPAFLVLILAAVPVIMVSMGVNFVTEMFNSLLEGITGIFRNIGGR